MITDFFQQRKKRPASGELCRAEKKRLTIFDDKSKMNNSLIIPQTSAELVESSNKNMRMRQEVNYANRGELTVVTEPNSAAIDNKGHLYSSTTPTSMHNRLESTQLLSDDSEFNTLDLEPPIIESVASNFSPNSQEQVAIISTRKNYQHHGIGLCLHEQYSVRLTCPSTYSSEVTPNTGNV